MGSLVSSLLAVGCLLGGTDDAAPQSYLYQPAFSLDGAHRLPATPYCPQPGDIVFATDYTVFWTVTHNYVGAFHPHHSAIIIRLPDGRLGMFEGGPHDTLHLEIMDLLPNMAWYAEDGRVWVRPRAKPLTPEQSDRLTEFALKQVGKRFALIRQGAQLTPFRTRGPLRTWFVGKPAGPDRCSYYCSEVVTEAIVYAGLLAAEDARPPATYPHDLFMDWSLNPFLNRHFKLAPDWCPPSLWTACLDYLPRQYPHWLSKDLWRRQIEGQDPRLAQFRLVPHCPKTSDK
jgi:hypothetical protein